MTITKGSERPTAIIITIVYFIVSVTWTMFADNLFAVLLNRPELMEQSAGPGHWFFIAFSTGMLYWLLRFWEETVVTGEESLKKVNRSLRSLSECSRAINRLEDETALMQEICRICVEVGGHRMAWVAFKEHNPEKSLRPVAHWGADNVYLENLQASWAGDSTIGQGPAGTSIRTGEVVVFQNLSTNPRFSPWRSETQKYGYASCVALPLKERGETYGALIIFNGRTGAFTADKIDLLMELTEDLAYGIRTLRMQQARNRELEERLMLAVVMDQNSNGIIVFDAEGIIQYVNSSFIEMCGVEKENCLGVSIHDFECSLRNPEFYGAILGVFSTNEPLHARFVNKKRDGSTYDIDARIAPVFDAAGHVVRYVATVRDISQELILQRQLRQAQKMEALATLSGGIAHDFNNILAIIITNVEMCQEDLPPDSPLSTSMDLVLKAGLRGKNLVRQFLSMSRTSEQPQKLVRITDIVDECLTMLRATLPTTIELRRSLPEKIGRIFADPTQIHQVIMNLCTNAGDAMASRGGILEISVDEVVLKEKDLIRYPGLKTGPHVRLIVADTGHGMDEEVLERIFDPFFTTKAQGKGTGLGLSIAHGIIKSHRGHISANSFADVGTTFFILLPIAEQADEVVPVAATAPDAGGQGRIIFVDDEADYVAGMKTALERAGYQAVTETDSRRVIELVRQNPQGYDLLITDQNMPHLSGIKLAQQIAKIQPGLPILLCSGAVSDTELDVGANNDGKTGIVQVLAKPVERAEMLATIDKILRRHHESPTVGMKQ